MHAHFDCFSGAAGDMLLAACLDAAEEDPAVLLDHLASQLRRAVPAMADEFSVSCRRVWKGSGRIAAWHVQVESVYHHAPAPVPGSGTSAAATATECGGSSSHQHEHSHTHQQPNSDNHSHEHQHQHTNQQLDTTQSGHEHEHSHSARDASHHAHSHSHTTTSSAPPIRNLPEIRRLLSDTPEAIEHIPPSVRSLAVKTFTELAHAEAHVHGASSIDDVHFHEVGAIDSIVDIVLTCWALHHILDGVISSVSCSPLPLGRGRVKTAHGILPVPAPATLFLLRDVVSLTEGPPQAMGELVTPTAAALLRALMLLHSKATTSLPSASRLRRIGVGAGTKEFPGHPNIVRVLVLEPEIVLPDKQPPTSTS